MAKYEMTLDLNVLNHLGLNLYSNTPSVLSEVIANSYDADALAVLIDIDEDNSRISIVDDGNGMTLDEINTKFLKVGYQKRINGEALSKKYKRPVMGRKGIGKLSLLSIANTIEIHSIAGGQNGNALKLSKEALQQDIAENKSGVYIPEEIAFVDFGKEHGTKIIISDFERGVNRTPNALRSRLSKRFSIKKLENPFNIILNGTEISLEDRKFFNKVEFLWPIGNSDIEKIRKYTNIRVQLPLNETIDGLDIVISGWIAAVDKPSDLKTDGDNNNIISVITRGKLAQEDILSQYNEGGVYANYLIGEIHADFLDNDELKDIATSNRQQYNENDERFKKLQSHIYKLLKTIQSQWTDLRNDISGDKAVKEIPQLEVWRATLGVDTRKAANKLFATIENLHFDKDIEKKKEIYKFGILAFERLRVKDKLSELEKLPAESLEPFGRIFSDLQDIEASLYYDIAHQRVEIIKQLEKCCNENAKEKVIQQHLYDNLWLLDASWDRATDSTARMEEKVKTEFDKITAALTKEENAGRIDIRYKTTAGKHVIIELKRYIAGYKIDEYSLGRQIDKYKTALEKCLTDGGIANPYVECVCVVGPKVFQDINTANSKLSPVLNARIITYDSLIENALASYSEYMKQNVKIGKIRTLIDSL